MTEEKESLGGSRRQVAGEGAPGDVGRLAFLLEEARTNLEEARGVVSERSDLRGRIERAITELEHAIAKAAPRFE